MSNAYGDNIFLHSRSLNYRIIDDIAPLFEDFVGNKEPDFTPYKFTLSQNYPNPFNPITTFSYELPNVAQVRIIIYDVLGRKIKSLINTEQSAGFHSLRWDATNDIGESVAAGMYLYTIQAGEFRDTKKMILLK